MAKVVKQDTNKCTSCGAKLEFDPSVQKLRCVKCKASYDIETQGNYTKHVYDNDVVDKFDASTEPILFKCKTCGASISMDAYQIASTCPYCLSPCVIEVSELPGLKPDAVVPFLITKDQVYNSYRQSVRKKFFLPNNFKKNVPIENIQGLYIPAFGFDSDTHSTYNGVLETDHRDKDGHSYTETKHISGNIDLKHRDILIENCVSMSQKELNDILPYNISNAVKYDNGYIQGYTMSYYNEKVSYTHKKAEHVMDNSIRSSILKKYSFYNRVRYLNVNTDFNNNKYCFYLLPMYRIKHVYKGKEYYNYLNGQTGKSGGKVPRSGVKITFFIIFIIALLGVIGYFLYRMGILNEILGEI